MGVERVVARRRRERQELLDLARRYVAGLPERLGMVAAVVVGSVARGDFNRWSDVDVVVVAAGLPDRLLERLDAVAPRPPRIAPIPWTPSQWHEQVDRGNTIAVEALQAGVWLVGSPSALDAATPSAGTGA